MNIEKHIEKCPINETIDLLKRKWVIVILRDLFYGKCRFKDFLKSNPDLSKKQLSFCLDELEDNKLIKREVKNNPYMIVYKLTSKGKSLNKILYEISIFTVENNDYSEILKNCLKENFKKNIFHYPK